jgi:hypothetical protein
MQPDIAPTIPEASDVARDSHRARQAQPDIVSWGVKKRLEFIDR